MRKILIAEDTDRKYDDLVSVILKFFGEEHETVGIERVSSYMEAQRMLRERYHEFEGKYKYDFVICDNIMPFNHMRDSDIGTYGIEIIADVRDKDEKIPIIACSSEKMDDYGQNYTIVYSVWNLEWHAEIKKAFKEIISNSESDDSPAEVIDQATQKFLSDRLHTTIIGESRKNKKWPPDNRRKRPKL